MRISYVHNPQNIDWSGLTGLTELTLALAKDDSQLHPSIGSFSSLQRLTFGNCGGLGTLPAEIGQLSNLTALHLGDDFDPRDFALPEAISGLVRLRELRVTASTMHMPQSIELPSSLTALHMGSAVKLPASLSTLSRLRNLEFTLLESALDTLPALRNMPSVRRLEVDMCNTVADQRVGKMLAHASLTCLRVLRQDNNMASVHAALPTLINLRELHLVVTESRAPGSHQPLPPAVDIPSSISNLSRLTRLSLSSPCNNIPPWLFLLTSLQALEIGCSCDPPNPYGRIWESPEMCRLSPDVSKLVHLREFEFPEHLVYLCANITRLPELTSVSGLWDGDWEHQDAVKALLARGVKYNK
jgi:hypothetical protein